MTRVSLLILFAFFVASCPARACDIGAATILTIPSADGRSALLDVQNPGDGRSAQACLQVARCRWNWKPSDAFLEWIARNKQQKAFAKDCGAAFTLVNDVDHVLRLTCPLSTSIAQPFVFASQVVAAHGAEQCTSTAVTTTSDTILTQARLMRSDLTYCLKLQWSLSTKHLLVSFKQNCDASNAPESAPTSTINVGVIHPKASIVFDVNLSKEENWALASVLTRPNTPYLSRWANAVRTLDLATLAPPAENLDYLTGQTAVQLPDLIGRWTLAMLQESGNSDSDLPLRIWMAELELRNSDKAKDTLLRPECIEPTDISSCQSQ